ncbi:succinyl-diaminopimelate desuccinylase [Protaetiibacter larvae]|uniref:Succinyl-diaminopimelate desuccinylase n=1 Tax=Protaetiibacter larvae TaxID=2592654 RepID=A0A5C1Y7J4_9MICO|nr:succinyl-diaminopimelate desuccinylase [Protaetiibacter larvae]QEO09620.1 succinyl-diaminopimelate desuccinylase [Protaetiibacter larvae]
MPALDAFAPVAELTRQLVDIRSESGDEAAVADAIEAVVRAAPHLEVVRDGNVIVARTRLGRAQRVVIAGHIDTVPINGNVPSWLGDGVDGPVLWGRGTVDMKAGCAVALALAVQLPEPAVDVTWVWYDNEEVDSSLNGLGRIARERPELLAADFAILGEPSGAEVEGGCNGTIRVDVTTRGRRAHSARAWMGENAIHAVAPVLARLAAYRAREVEVDGLVYRESLSAVRISGGVAGNVIPDETTVHVNYRFAPSRSGAEALAHLEELFAGLPVEITVADLAEGARPGLDAPLAQQFVAAVGAEARPKYGWTDVARFSALGIPAVNFGPGDPSLAHADDERVPLAQIDRVETALRRWLTAVV